MLTKVRFIWHKFWFFYNKSLINSCLDEKYREKLIRKALYHEKQYLRYCKLNEKASIAKQVMPWA